MGPKLRSHLATAVVALALGGGVLLVGAALFVWSGLFDVAASSGHSPPVAWLLHFAMRRSVAFHAPKLTPPNLDDPMLILRGATHFATGCAPCHGAPGEVASPIAQRMMPVPPGLYSVGRDFTPDQLFWIVQHGVKMTAMPAWPAPQRQDEIWAMVAFLRHLPEYKTQAYRQLSGLSGGTGMLSQPPAASADSSSFDPAACARCHGGDGNGRGGAFPRLAGLSAAYIAQSLAAFRDGSRPSGFMQPVAAALTDAEINQAANYFSRQVPHPTTPAADIPAQLLKDGQAVATAPTGPGTTPGCLGCHQRNIANPAIPDLAGQPEDYLETQLRLFHAGARGESEGARAMSRIAQRLSDHDMTAVAAYLSTLPPCPTSAANGCTPPAP